MIKNVINKIFNSKEYKSLIANFLSLSTLQALDLFLPMITFPYLIRVLGVDNFGLVAFAQSFILYFTVFVDFGFNYSATRRISINRLNTKKVSEIFSSVIQIKIIFLFISFVILHLIVGSFEKFSSDSELYYMTFIYVIGRSLIPTWFFQGIEEMKYLTYINIIAKGIFTVLIFLLIKERNMYLFVPLINGIGFIIAAMFSLFLVFRNYKIEFKISSYRTILFYVKDSFDFFLSRLSVSIFNSSNIFVLGIFNSNLIVGYFSIAQKIYNALKSLFSPVTRTLYPYISYKKNIQLFKKIFYFLTTFNIIIVCFFWFFAPSVIKLISGDSLLISTSIFRILIVYSIFTVPCSLLGYSFLAAIGFKNFANNSVIIASILHILGVVILSYFNSVTIYNITYLIAFSESIVLIIRVYGIRKHNLWSKKF